MTTPTCGVCGSPLTPDWMDPPTFTLQPVPDHPATFTLHPGAVRPVLNKPIRMDPETGAVCWCPVTTLIEENTP